MRLYDINTMKLIFICKANNILLGLFFFQAEDGIRDWSVTGVQTCALPICRRRLPPAGRRDDPRCGAAPTSQIGRASCRERGEISVGAVSLKKKKKRGKETKEEEGGVGGTTELSRGVGRW